MSAQFELDTDRAKLLGVCAGFARMINADPFLVRLGTVVLSLFVAPAMILLYLLVGWIAPKR